MESDYTLLPFFEIATAAKLMIYTAVAFIAVLIVRAVIFKTSLTLHKAPVTVAFAYISCGMANILLCTFLYWYWALPVCLVLSIIYAFTAARDVNESNSEERTGVWGLNKDIRRIRGELFNDMSIAEQLKYRESVKETNFSKILFILITMSVPVIAIAVFHFINIGYLFFPVLIG